MTPASFWSVLLAAVSAVILGMAWYHPRAFGTLWLRLGHITPEHAERAAERMVTHSALSFGACLLMALALSVLAGALELEGAGGSVVLASFLWLGFAVPLLSGSFLWEQRSSRFYGINAGYWLVALMVMSFIVVP
ncbi:DUF1761 domain-containing protein [Candidatus Kaiserbacteria bacterium]|nr:DUF1761 domain-containing protein [Candidatus Kaiserbacteria bacterium]